MAQKGAYRARLPGRLHHPTTIRATLYMAALTAIRHNPAMRLFAKRLQKNGKPSKLAITAVMRKLIGVCSTPCSDPAEP